MEKETGENGKLNGKEEYSLTKEKNVCSYKELLDRVKKYVKEESELAQIDKAYQYALSKHALQYRKSGDQYISHPLSVAIILTSIYADVPSIVASLLHDVMVECDVSKDEILDLFGSEVEGLVSGVTKLTKIHFSTENDYLVEYYKKIIVGMSEDVRVIVIKLAERLHNMRTLFALPSDKQKEVAKETLEIFAPIAHHLGIHKIKSELEDLSLRYLKPDVFYDIAERLNNTKLERDTTVSVMQQEVSQLLSEHHISFEMKGRAKSIYSIYNKLNKGKKFSDIYDLLALRILVDTEQDCYLALGIIHSKFKPLPKRFKDYIAMPKPNGYQSLHTTVFGVTGQLFEVQIRTHQMNEMAENGVASHWAYKEQKDASKLLKNTTEQKLQFFKAMMEVSLEDLSKEDLVSSIREEVLNDNIYVFTPRGDVIELPKWATPIDFAYRVHTRVGETMVGAIVNDAIVPLNYELQDNDVVKINTNKNGRPSKEWIHIAKSNQTKNKIRSFFSKSEKEVYQERGKEMLEKELRKRKISFSEFLTDDHLKEIFAQLHLTSLDELYLTIGNLKTPVNSVINIIYKREEEVVVPKVKLSSKQVDQDIIIAGIDKVKVSLALCCSPIPGDDLIGYITKGNGITIHRTTCPNLSHSMERFVKASWSDTPSRKYLTTVMIYTNTMENKLVEIIQKASAFDVSIDRIVTTSHGEKMNYEVDFYVMNVAVLEKMMASLWSLPYILNVERIIR